ncbi:MAG: sigma 54-interacting transcriptional regulator [Bryobacteraceae bacterium]
MAASLPNSRDTRRVTVTGAGSQLFAQLEQELRPAGVELDSALNGEPGPDTVTLLVHNGGTLPALPAAGGPQQAPLIFIDTAPSVDTAVQVMRSGAWDYIGWPAPFGRLAIALKAALRHHENNAATRQVRETLNRRAGFEALAGSSPSLLHALDVAARAASSHSPILIRGEAGTEKLTLARAIHNASGRERFLALEAPSSDELDSLASDRDLTLYIDEVADLDAPAQGALLRILEDPSVRVIVATGLNLAQAMDARQFRRDLYFRLAAVQIELPPLRDRLQDLPELVSRFLTASSERHAKSGITIGEPLLARLRRWHWPGNVDELEILVERLTVIASGNQLSVEDLPEQMNQDASAIETLRLELPADGISLEAVERELLMRSLERFNGNQTRAARYLGLTRKTLIYRMDKFNLRATPRRTVAVAAE